MSILHRADSLLRGAPLERADETAHDVLHEPTSRLIELLAIAVTCGLLYGAAMGTFSGVWGGRGVQIVYSSLKVPILLLLTFAISLPSFFVFNTLLGLRDDFGHAMRALISAQAGLAIVLVSLAPLTVFWYASSADYQTAVLYNAVMFAIASFCGQKILRRAYAPLIARNPDHRKMLRLWLVVYVFVGIQMGWVLRPFIGHPDAPSRFFREDAWTNAYVLIGRLILQVARRIVGAS